MVYLIYVGINKCISVNFELFNLIYKFQILNVKKSKKPI